MFHMLFKRILFLVCDRGFRGKNCGTKCSYPTYGEGCQSLCNCNITYCDYVNGCTVSSGGTGRNEYNLSLSYS